MPNFTKEGTNTAGMKGSEFYGYGNAAPKYKSPLEYDPHNKEDEGMMKPPTPAFLSNDESTSSTSKKQFYVDNYETHKDKEGFKEAMDKEFGGDTTVKGRTSITTKNEAPTTYADKKKY